VPFEGEEEFMTGVDMCVLVTGATGMQGGAVARELRRRGVEVTALVRDEASDSSRALADSGVHLMKGDLDDPESLATACAGHAAVFSVQLPPTRDQDSERRQAQNLVRAAREAGVRHFVHTSVSGTGWRDMFPDVDPGVTENYWQSKEDVEATVRGAGFESYTIFKPAYFMENFVLPKAPWMWPLLAEGELLVASAPTTRVSVVCAEDFGAAVATAVARPQEFAGVEVELGSDAPTFPQIAETIAAVTGRSVHAACRPAAEVDERLGRRSWSPTMVWLDVVGYPAQPSDAEPYGLDMSTTFAQWAQRHRAELIEATTPAVE
jgi:uncharacterized protein YbjT (DUF2867 family)